MRCATHPQENAAQARPGCTHWRRCGAFFIRRSFADDALYKAIFSE
jgi:hypothetical protein